MIYDSLRFYFGGIVEQAELDLMDNVLWMSCYA